MNDQQPELLEQFLQALRQDRHAVPPVGLDPDIAEFARRMVQQTSVPTTRARSRMWEQALAKSRSTSNGHYNHVNHKELDKMAVITARPTSTEGTGTRFSLTLVAAAVAAVLCITIFMMLPKGSPDNPSLIAGAPDVQQESTQLPIYTVTATPVPAIVVTATPVPMAVITNTPIPADAQLNPAGTVADIAYVYSTLLAFDDALALLHIDTDDVQNVEFIYRVTLNSGEVALIYIVPIPEGVASSEMIRDQFPNAYIYGSDPISYRGQTFVVTPLDNGILVVVDPTSQRIMYLSRGGSSVVPMMGQPTALPPSTMGDYMATPTPVMPDLVVTATMTATNTWTPTPVP